MNVTKVRHRPTDWITRAEAQEVLHCSHNTMAKILAEMRDQVGKRYKYPITAEHITHTVLIDRLALNDYMRYRKHILNKITIPPYDPKGEAWALGYYDEVIGNE